MYSSLSRPLDRPDRAKFASIWQRKLLASLPGLAYGERSYRHIDTPPLDVFGHPTERPRAVFPPLLLEETEKMKRALTLLAITMVTANSVGCCCCRNAARLSVPRGLLWSVVRSGNDLCRRPRGRVRALQLMVAPAPVMAPAPCVPQPQSAAPQQLSLAVCRTAVCRTAIRSPAIRGPAVCGSATIHGPTCPVPHRSTPWLPPLP